MQINLKLDCALYYGLGIHFHLETLNLLKMTNTDKQALQVEKDYFKSNKEFLDNIVNLKNVGTKIDYICDLLKSLNNYFESNIDVNYSEKEMRNNQTEAIQSSFKVINELDDRISKLENLIEEIASNSLKLAETMKNNPPIDIDKLLKILNEHSDDIKKLKDKLIK